MTVQNRSRRDFLRQVALLGVSGLLAACGNRLPAADTAEKPAGSGTLRLVHTLEWAGKEVLSPASPVRFFPTIELLYNRLVRMSEAGTLVPELATE